MSATTAPLGANTPDPAIAAAQTQNDMVRVIVNNPGLQAAVISALQGLLTGDKSFLQSKTVWAAIITPFVGYAVARFGLGLDDATVGAIDTGLVSAMMLIMRTVTSKPITGIVSAGSGS